jgi:hypothetical protein
MDFRLGLMTGARPFEREMDIHCNVSLESGLRRAVTSTDSQVQILPNFTAIRTSDPQDLELASVSYIAI